MVLSFIIYFRVSTGYWVCSKKRSRFPKETSLCPQTDGSKGIFKHAVNKDFPDLPQEGRCAKKVVS